jgi:UDP-N-acetylmuramate-alanine ligase
MNIETIKSVYFVGAGGIGMSALFPFQRKSGSRIRPHPDSID